MSQMSGSAPGGKGPGKKKAPLPYEPPKTALFWLEHAMYAAAIVGLFCWLAPYISGVFREQCARSSACSRHMKPGVFGEHFLVDLNDAQWRDLREAAAPLIGGLIGFSVISQAVRRLSSDTATSESLRLGFSLLFSAGLLVYLHGSSTFFIVALTLGNYAIGSICGSKVWKVSFLSRLPFMIGATPVFTWLYGIVIIFCNEWYHQYYTFATVFPPLRGLDAYKGVYRWHLGFNLILLKMISFNMDRYWAASHVKAYGADTATPLSYRWRERNHALPEDYGLRNYLAYLFYAPLFLAGPTITFNAWISQIHTSQTTYSPTGVAVYALRWVVAGLCLEAWLHFFPVFGIADAGLYKLNKWPPHFVLILGWLLINALWLKFLVLWRFFRLWALCDGVEAVENMNRCVNNNYTLAGFWRSWHRSFNQWLVRYIYIPLGGKKYRLFNVWVVFTFVALWHDLTFKLLAWGWLLALFFVPETLLGGWLSRQQWLTSKWYYRHIAAFGAVGNIAMLMAANLVGFSVGTDGVAQFLDMIFTLAGLRFVALAIAVVFGAGHLMFLVRRLERERKASASAACLGAVDTEVPAAATGRAGSKY